MPTEQQYAARAEASARFREANIDLVRERQLEAQRRYRAKNKEKTNARRRVYVAIQKGKLVRPNECQSCFVECKPEASHSDYSKPLEVQWYCKSCHCVIDRRVN